VACLQLLVCGPVPRCVKYTVIDILAHWNKDKGHVVLLQDACPTSYASDGASPRASDEFLDSLTHQGVTMSTIDEALMGIDSSLSSSQ
jgi:hypothetical protein